MRRWPEENAGPRGLQGLAPFGRALLNGATDLSDCLGWRDPERPWLLTIWEPLPTKAPSPARCYAYCCYIDTVIFYASPHMTASPRRWRRPDGTLAIGNARSLVEYDRCTHRLTFEDLVRFEGQAFEVNGGRVIWKRRRWWMVRAAHRGTTRARQANGMPIEGPSWPAEVAHA